MANPTFFFLFCLEISTQRNKQSGRKRENEKKKKIIRDPETGVFIWNSFQPARKKDKSSGERESCPGWNPSGRWSKILAGRGVSSRDPTNNQLGRQQQVKTKKETKTVLMRQTEGLDPYKLQGRFCHSSTLSRTRVDTVLHSGSIKPGTRETEEIKEVLCRERKIGG